MKNSGSINDIDFEEEEKFDENLWVEHMIEVVQDHLLIEIE